MGSRFTSVRARVTLAAAGVVLVVLVLMAVVVVQAHRSLLVESLDESMEEAADQLVERLEAGEEIPAVAGFGDDDAAFQVVDDGVVVAASPNLHGAAPMVDDTAGIQTVTGLPHDPERFRVLSTSSSSGGGEVVVHLAATLDDVEDSADALTRVLLVTVPAVTALLAVGIWFFVGRALRPVEAIRAEVADIGGTDLDRRVPEPPGDDEVARLARTMNGMLERVEVASERQARFVADASHELRSPLTRMRTELEVDRAHPDRADPVATRDSVLEEVLGLQRTVEDLLHLARADSGVTAVASEPVALHEVVAQGVADLRAATGLAVDAERVALAVVEGRPEALRRLVANLLDNAGRHARRDVRVTLDAADGTATLAVSDDGPGIPLADRQRVFERFTRLDAARSGSSGGTGLGLAIVREVAEQHGGTVAVEDGPGGGARFVVTLPAAPPPA